MCREIYPGQIYRHFKDKLYQIVTVATHSETKEKMVIYQQLYGDFEVYARPYDMFMSEVDRKKYPDVEQKYRFELVKVKQSGNTNIHKDCIVTGNGTTQKTNLFEMEKEDKKVIEKVEIKEKLEGVNPHLIAFLEADTYEEKREILVSAREEISHRLIDDIAASMDVAVPEGDIEERFNSLLSCVATLSKYEINRLR